MAPPKTGFKTYEAQTRLLAAVLATNKGLRLDFKALAEHCGMGMSPSSIDHRLRPIKQLAKMQAKCVEKKEDPGELPIEKSEIQKAFGESTADGLEWQFRGIKRLAKAQNDAVAKGEPTADLNIGSIVGGERNKDGGTNSVVSTPAKSRTGTSSIASTPRTGGKAMVAKTPSSRVSKLGAGVSTHGSAGSFTAAAAAAASGGKSHKRRFGVMSSSDDPDDPEYEDQDMDDTSDYGVAPKSGRSGGRGGGKHDPDETPTGRKKKQPRLSINAGSPTPFNAKTTGGKSSSSIFNNKKNNRDLFNTQHDTIDLADEDIDEDIHAAAAHVKKEPGVFKKQQTTTTATPAFGSDAANYDIPNPYSSSSPYQAAGSGYFGGESGDGYGDDFDHLNDGEA